jgi:hypothetical protein
MSGTYLGEFTPGNVCLNYLGDGGLSVSTGATNTYSLYVPANSVFTVLVNEVGSTGDYSLSLAGGDCQPVLNIIPLTSPNVQVSWPVVAGGYQLENSTAVSPASWSGAPGTPMATSGRFNVTNTASGATRFYRLHKP